MSSSIILASFLLILSTNQILVESQHLSSLMDDKTYFDNIQYEIEGEVEEAKENLVDQAKIVEVATRNFAASKLKQNFLKALRYLAEKELESISMQNRLRQPRQNDDEDGDNGEDGDSTSKRTVPLIPALANILKAVVGDNSTTLNFTTYLQGASKFLFRPIGRPFIGLTNLLGLTKPAVPEAPVKGRETANDLTDPDVPLNTTTSEHYIARLLKENVESLDLMDILVPNITLAKNMTTENFNYTDTTETPMERIRNGTDPSVLSLPEAEAVTGTPGGVIYIDLLAKDIQHALDGLLKAMPDLFKGAKEALTLLETIRDIYEPRDN